MTLHGQILGQNLIVGLLGKVSSCRKSSLWKSRWVTAKTSLKGSFSKFLFVGRNLEHVGTTDIPLIFWPKFKQTNPYRFSSVPTWWRLRRLWLSQSKWSPLFRCCLASKWTTQFHRSPKTLQCYTYTTSSYIIQGRFAYILQIFSERFPNRWSSFQQKSSYPHAISRSTSVTGMSSSCSHRLHQLHRLSRIVPENMNMSCVSIIEHRYELSILSFPQKLYAELEFNLDSEIFVNLWSTTYNHIQTYNAYVYIRFIYY